MKKLQNKVGLIVYPDSMGGSLGNLKKVLGKHFSHTFGHIHILPFYPSSADRGFAPITYKEVDPSFGTWKDIHSLSRETDIMADIMLNHISAKSPYFQDYLKYGKHSIFRDFFITSQKFSRHIQRTYHTNNTHEDLIGKIHFSKLIPKAFQRVAEHFIIPALEWLAWKVRKYDPILHKDGVWRFSLNKIYRPRPGSPFIPFIFQDKHIRKLWCTFSKEQIDLDMKNPAVRQLLIDNMSFLSQQGITAIRLDAAGYIAKRRGSTNFLIPETYQLITYFSQAAQRLNLSTLPEVHAHFSSQKHLTKTPGVEIIYDFPLSLLILQAIFDRSNTNLKNWIRIRPNNCITTLDTHDGLPVPDVEGLMTTEEQSRTCNHIHRNGGNDTLRASGITGNNLDIYQINCTYYSALGENDDAYILARAIQFFIPGIPQVYYVGLLAGKNDHARLKSTGIGRDINRHTYSQKEIVQELNRPVVKRLLTLMHLRNTHPAFQGNFHMKRSANHILILRWEKDMKSVELYADLNTQKSEIRYYATNKLTKKEFL